MIDRRAPAAGEGWGWFDPAQEPAAEDELARRFARCFGSDDGERALQHLRRVFGERRCPPSVSDAQLRHVEGQRSTIAYIDALVERGRAGNAS